MLSSGRSCQHGVQDGHDGDAQLRDEVEDGLAVSFTEDAVFMLDQREVAAVEHRRGALVLKLRAGDPAVNHRRDCNLWRIGDPNNTDAAGNATQVRRQGL